MASLIKQHGLYYLQFYSDTRNPQRKRVPLKVRLKRDAQRIQRKLEADYALGSFDSWHDDPLTYGRLVIRPESLKDAASDFYAAKTHLAERTRGEYRKIIDRFVSSMGATGCVSKVDSSDIQRWLDTTKTNDVTRHNYTRHLKVFFRWCRSEGLTDSVATDGVRLRKVPRKFERFLEPEEVD